MRLEEIIKDNNNIVFGDLENLKWSMDYDEFESYSKIMSEISGNNIISYQENGVLVIPVSYEIIKDVKEHIKNSGRELILSVKFENVTIVSGTLDSDIPVRISVGCAERIKINCDGNYSTGYADLYNFYGKFINMDINNYFSWKRG